MQLRFAVSSPFRTLSDGFNISTLSILAGITVAGTFASIILNSQVANSSIVSTLNSVKQVLKNSYLYEGVKNIGNTFKDWGTAIVNARDDFGVWLHNYLNASGFKSGVISIYNKLYEWGLIVYTWFKDSFLEFISNIPKMVENWRKLRLSLFKWGTFLGGGGGNALWAMFGSSANWDKLGELMSRPDFADIADKFGKLMENNSEAFENMKEEEVQEILEKFLYETDEAKEATEKLLEKQEEKKKETKNDEEELSTEEIEEAFQPPSGGNPPDVAGVFGSMVANGLNKLITSPPSNSYFSDATPQSVVRKEMEEYIKLLEKDIERESARKKEGTPKQEFMSVVKGEKFDFINELSKVAEKAYNKIAKSTPPKVELDNLIEKFMEEFDNSFTEDAHGGEGDVNISKEIFKVVQAKKKK